MDILFYHPVFDANDWIPQLQKQLPNATIHQYKKGDNPPADYALIWHPSHEMLAHRTTLKAIIALGAGVDSILGRLTKHPDLLPANVPLYRLYDAGMAKQMQEYTIAAVMRYFRRLDEYQILQSQKEWQYLMPHSYDKFTIGIMGLGVLGTQVANALIGLGFSVKGYSYSAKQIKNIDCYHHQQLPEFLSGIQLLINLLPSTELTNGILNTALFNQLNKGAYLINIARGRHLIEQDLITAIENQQIKAATLDVFTKEPLPKDHAFWNCSAITITPHISAQTLADIAISQIVSIINDIEQGKCVTQGLVDLEKGY